MGVKNGVIRPVALHYFTFDAYSCPLMDHNRSVNSKFFGNKTSSCPPVGHKEYRAFLEDKENTANKVEDETDFAGDYTWSVKMSFYLTKGPLWLFSWPMNLVAKMNPRWGMEHIPNARCPGKTKEEMQAICVQQNEDNKDTNSKNYDVIENHLR